MEDRLRRPDQTGRIGQTDGFKNWAHNIASMSFNDQQQQQQQQQQYPGGRPPASGPRSSRGSFSSTEDRFAKGWASWIGGDSSSLEGSVPSMSTDRESNVSTFQDERSVSNSWARYARSDQSIGSAGTGGGTANLTITSELSNKSNGSSTAAELLAATNQALARPPTVIQSRTRVHSAKKDFKKAFASVLPSLAEEIGRRARSRSLTPGRAFRRAKDPIPDEDMDAPITISKAHAKEAREDSKLPPRSTMPRVKEAREDNSRSSFSKLPPTGGRSGSLK